MENALLNDVIVKKKIRLKRYLSLECLKLFLCLYIREIGKTVRLSIGAAVVMCRGITTDYEHGAVLG